MPKARRVIGVVAALATAATVLTGCEKPLPGVTVLSGKVTLVVKAQTYCFDTTHCHFPNGAISSIAARAGDHVLVDVPRSVAHQAWSVTSAIEKSNGTFQSFAGDNYASGTVRDRHSASVDVPYGTGTYYLVVTQVGTSSGSWVAEVKVHR